MLVFKNSVWFELWGRATLPRRALRDAQIPVGFVIDGNDQVDDRRAKDRQHQMIGFQDEQGGAEDSEINGKLEVASPNSQGLLEKDGQDIDAAETSAVAKENQKPRPAQATAHHGCVGGI